MQSSLHDCTCPSSADVAINKRAEVGAREEAAPEIGDFHFALGILLICVGVFGLGPGLLHGRNGPDVVGFLAGICFVSLFASAACSIVGIGYAREKIRLFAAINGCNVLAVGFALAVCVGIVVFASTGYRDPASPFWSIGSCLLFGSLFLLALSNLLGFVSICYLKKKRVFTLFALSQFILLLSVILSLLMMAGISPVG